MFFAPGGAAGRVLASGQGESSRVDGTARFEVVSVRPSKAGGQLSFGVTGNGFQARNTPLFWIVMDAYCPLAMSYWKSDRLEGGPAWLRTEGFDIGARVGEAEVKAFTGLSDAEREARVQPMLREMLAERFGLRVQLVNRPAALLGLVVGKGGPKVEVSKQGAAVPTGIALGDGGVEVPVAMEDGRHGMRYYRTSMAKFAEVLSGLGDERDLPIVDRTGMAGVYDFVLRMREEDGAAGVPRPATFWDVEALGLRLKRVVGALPTVVVERVEVPGAN